jgi:SDR family mycofactocin-dependent oxidoreductase
VGMLDGKVALVTGAARGQGRAHAVTCAREGADVILVDIADQMPDVPYVMGTEQDLADSAAQVLALGRRALVRVADVRSQEELDGVVLDGVNELGKIDILIANAGIWTVSAFWQISEHQWNDMMAVNTTGVWHAVKSVASHMIGRKTGSIVITSSVRGLAPAVGYAHYVASKHAVIGLMKSVALELAPFGVRCNAVCPGAIRTPMNDHQSAWDLFAGHEGGTRADMDEAGYRYHALKGCTWLPPQEVANAALFLNSDLARTVTGTAIPVDAGHLLLDGVNLDPVRQ